MKRFEPQKYLFQDQFHSFSLFHIHEYRGKHDIGLFCLADMFLSRMRCEHSENLNEMKSSVSYKQSVIGLTEPYLTYHCKCRQHFNSYINW